MNAPVKPEAVAETTELVALVTANPVMVLTDPVKFDAFYERVKAETDAFVPDLSTDTSRKQIAAMAFKVTKTKTAIEAARKQLTEDARKQVDAVNAAGREIRERLESLAAEVRKPLTDWEVAEGERIASCHLEIARLKEAGVVGMDDSSATAAARLADLDALTIDETLFQELAPLGQMALDASRLALGAAVARLTQEEADRAELDRLRAEAAARAEADRLAQEAAAAAELARRQAEQDARDEAARLARQAAEADAEAARVAERARLDQERAEAAEAARKANEEAAAARAETERLQAAQRQRDAAAAAAEAATRAEEEAARAREENRAHRSKFMGEAKKALMGAGLAEEAAKAVVNAIVAGSIPHVTFKF